MDAVTIEGLDGDYVQQTQTITLTGQVAAILDDTWLRAFRIYGDEGVSNAGTLTLRVSVAGATVALVDIGSGQTTMAVYTIPANTIGVLGFYSADIILSYGVYALGNCVLFCDLLELLNTHLGDLQS